MPTLRKEKINKLIDTALLTENNPKKKEEAINLARRIPLLWENIEHVHNYYDDLILSDLQEDEKKDIIDNDPLLKMIEEKEQERYLDSQKVLEEAVERGIENVDDLCEWLHIDNDSSMQQIIDKMHLYKKIGSKGKPELAVLQ